MEYDEVVVEEEYDEVVVPLCYGFYDPRDVSCGRCPLNVDCQDYMLENAPHCFGYDYDEQLCTLCLINTYCIEEKEKIERSSMSSKTVRVKRSRRRPVKQVVEEPKVEEVVVDDSEGEDQDYVSWTIRDLRGELKDRGLESKGRKSVLISRLKEYDAGFDGSEDEEPEEEVVEETPKPKVTRRSRRKRSKPEPKVEEAEAEAEATEISIEFDGDPLAQLVQTLDAGKSLVVTITDGGYQVQVGDAVQPVTAKVRGVGVTGRAFKQEVLNPKYTAFDYEDCGCGKGWRELTKEEREEYAFEELDVAVDGYEDLHTLRQGMLLKVAVVESLGIDKYKPEYASRSSRKLLKEQGIFAS